MQEENKQENTSAGEFDRRELMKRGLGATAAAALIGPSAAAAGERVGLGSLSAAAPTRGGTLTIAATTGGTTDTFDPGLASFPSDAIRCYTTFDPLVRVAPHFSLEPGLAVNWTANKDNTVWEIELRPGVHWHDGKKFTADDVIYTLRRMGNPANLGHPAVTNVKLKDLKKLSPTLLRVPLTSPNARLKDLFIYLSSTIVVQNGAKDFSKPIGTGPFKVQSFTPGQQSVAVANRDYWDHPKPYLDKLVVLAIADGSARLNALLGGQANWCHSVSFALAAANKTNPALKLSVGASGPSQLFYMDVTKPPFNDVRVRQALKLVVDRQQMIDLALNGYGALGNDIVGRPGMIDYNKSLPQRRQDIEKAKSLLAAAGQSNLTITLHTSTGTAGMAQAAQVFAQQAKAAGITVNVQTEDPSAYGDPSLLFGKMSFAQDTWPLPSIDGFWNATLNPANLINETHWNNPKSFALLQQAIGTTPGPKRQKLWNEVQALQYEQGGNIVWAERLSVDAHALNVKGTKPGWCYSSNDHRYWDTWIAS